MQKKIWKDISSNFYKKGYDITDDQCSTKWKNLKQKYKQVRDNNNGTGRATDRWVYFDAIDDFLNTRPEVLPLSIASSSRGFKVRERSPHTDSEECNNENDSSTSNASYDAIRNVNKHKVRTRSTLMVQLYKQREDHHKKNIEMQERFLSLFEKYIDRDTV